MNINFNPNTQEKPLLIVFGVLALYILISGFIMYFYFMNKLSINLALILVCIFSILYIPRFMIIKKLNTQDNIKLSDEYIIINNKQYLLSSIADYKVKINKPQIIFFINNSMVIFQDSVFYLHFKDNSQEVFRVVGTEKIELVQEFFNKLLNKNSPNTFI